MGLGFPSARGLDGRLSDGRGPSFTLQHRLHEPDGAVGHVVPQEILHRAQSWLAHLLEGRRNAAVLLWREERLPRDLLAGFDQGTQLGQHCPLSQGTQASNLLDAQPAAQQDEGLQCGRNGPVITHARQVLAGALALLHRHGVLMAGRVWAWPVGCIARKARRSCRFPRVPPAEAAETVLQVMRWAQQGSEQGKRMAARREMRQFRLRKRNHPVQVPRLTWSAGALQVQDQRRAGSLCMPPGQVYACPGAYLAQSFRGQLADAFARAAKLSANFIERVRLTTGYPVAQVQDLLYPWVESLPPRARAKYSANVRSASTGVLLQSSKSACHHSRVRHVPSSLPPCSHSSQLPIK